MNITKKEQKILDFLTELHVKTSEPSQFSMAKFCKDNKIHNNIASILLKNKLLSVDKSFKIPVYSWITIKPNINTAKKVNEIFQAMNREINLKYKEKAEKEAQEIKEVEVSIKEEVVEQPKPQEKSFTQKKNRKEFSILWGLIKIRW
jgi:hypothetical protein